MKSKSLHFLMADLYKEQHAKQQTTEIIADSDSEVSIPEFDEEEYHSLNQMEKLLYTHTHLPLTGLCPSGKVACVRQLQQPRTPSPY